MAAGEAISSGSPPFLEAAPAHLPLGFPAFIPSTWGPGRKGKAGGGGGLNGSPGALAHIGPSALSPRLFWA